MAEIYNKLVQDGSILQELISDTKSSQLDSSNVINVLEASYNLCLDEETEELYYIDEECGKQIAPDLSDGMSESSIWLCDKLFAPFIDFDQGGSIRRIEEARWI